jgi:pilus assembly protein Flp/PilA
MAASRVKGICAMSNKGFLQRLRRDEKGASLIEYSVLIGIILVLAIASVRGVGVWVNSQWSNLNTTLNSN